MRKNIVAGNWKMNTLPSEGVALVQEIVREFKDNSVELIIAPPFTHLSELSKVISGSAVKLSSQNIAKELKGAYTGEVSGEMLKDMSVTHCIIGHSERRTYYGETDSIIADKIQTALGLGLIPIFCIGENLDERKAEKHFEVVEKQLRVVLENVSNEGVSSMIIAYEPVWAIGTGLTATPEQAQEIHAYIRAFLTQKYGEEKAESISILYGGSCKPDNAKMLFAQKDIDGGLIGGAALKADDFLKIASSF